MKTGCPALPAQNHRLLPVVEAGEGNSLEIREGVLVPANQGEELAVEGEIQVLPARMAQNIGKAENLPPSLLDEAYRVRAPVHLPLPAGFRFESHDRLDLRIGADCPEKIAHDALSTVEPGRDEFLVHPDSGYVRELLQKARDHGAVPVELARAAQLPFVLQDVVSQVAASVVFAQYPSDRVAAHSEVPGQRANRPAFRAHRDNPIFQRRPVGEEFKHRRLPSPAATRACRRTPIRCRPARTELFWRRVPTAPSRRPAESWRAIFPFLAAFP